VPGRRARFQLSRDQRLRKSPAYLWSLSSGPAFAGGSSSGLMVAVAGSGIGKARLAGDPLGDAACARRAKGRSATRPTRWAGASHANRLASTGPYREQSMLPAALIDRCTQFAHAAHENIEPDFVCGLFFQMARVRQIILDRIKLPREPSKQVLGKVARRAPPNLQIFFDGTVCRSLNKGLLRWVLLHVAPKSSVRLFIFDDGPPRIGSAVDAELRRAGCA
jgi:hypothetical protein